MLVYVQYDVVKKKGLLCIDKFEKEWYNILKTSCNVQTPQIYLHRVIYTGFCCWRWLSGIVCWLVDWSSCDDGQQFWSCSALVLFASWLLLTYCITSLHSCKWCCLSAWSAWPAPCTMHCFVLNPRTSAMTRRRRRRRRSVSMQDTCRLVSIRAIKYFVVL